MRIRAIATDYDGTLAVNGRAGDEALAALRRAQSAGYKLILITGREQKDLFRVLPDLSLFDLVVAENGALLYLPASCEEKMLCAPPPPELLAGLRGEGVAPLAIGRCIVATMLPHESAVLRTFHELQLNWYVIRNRESIMMLPSGIEKGSGFKAALRELRLQGEQVLGIGDAENDLAFLSLCGRSVAVCNALPDVKAAADEVTQGNSGAGVAEVVHQLLSGSFDR